MNKSALLGILLQSALLLDYANAQGTQSQQKQSPTLPQANLTREGNMNPRGNMKPHGNGTPQATTNCPPNNQPLMIPFDPNAPAAYRAVDLPPPTGLSRSDAASPSNSPSITAFPPSFPPFPCADSEILPGAVSTETAQQYLQLPDARQLLPRTLSPRDDSSVGTQSTLNIQSDLPPIPDIHTLSVGPTLTVTELNPTVRQGTGRTTNSSSLVSYQPQHSISSGPTSPVATDFRASHLVAIVGTERVLAGDLAAMVEPIIHENRGRISSQLQEEEVRQSLTRQALPQYVELKAMSQEFFRDMAGNVPTSELKKIREQVITRASRMFYERYVPLELFKRYKVEDLSELDKKLRETNLSVAVLRNYFLIQALSAQLEEKYVPESYEIPPDEILRYYQDNIQKWHIPARAKWRQLTVRFDRFGSEAEAQNRIIEMGNEVVLGGKSFDAVARDSSHGYTSQQGGMHDWTFEGSLKSKELNQAIFSLPLNRLSNTIRDDVGFHIIEVLQRESARTKDMAEIQTEIRKTLSKERRQKEAEAFRQKVLGRVVVWTRWPEDIPGSRPLAEALGETEP